MKRKSMRLVLALAMILSLVATTCLASYAAVGSGSVSELKKKRSTYLSAAFITGKTVEAECWNLYKGDVVKLTFKGKTYTKKIKKNFKNKKKTLKFKLKKKPAFDAKMKVVITTKAKKTLYKKTIRFSNFAYYD